jgi:two-component system LytT family sensor kinase
MGRRFPPRIGGLFAAAATVVGLLVTTQIYLSDNLPQYSFLQLVVWQLPGWYFWVAVSPIIWHLANPIGVGAAVERRNVLIIAGAAVASDLGYILVHTTAAFIAGILHSTFASAYVGQLTTRFHYGLVIFGAILSTAYAVEYGRQLADSETERSRTAAELAEARLNALQMQLRPHFLFNTLNTIAMLVREAGATRALDVVLHLSELLRPVMREAAARSISVREEFAFLSHYLEIERVRFEDRLTVQLSFAGDAESAAVPSLLLQPLVENALRHGIARLAGPGVVRVTAERAGERLRLTVSDNGPGFPARGHKAGTQGLGLSLVSRRLEQEFGGACSLDVRESHAGTDMPGVTVIIELPFQDARPSESAPGVPAAMAP